MANEESLDWQSLGNAEIESIEEALDQWEQGLHEGKSLSAEDVCRNKQLLPYVADRIQKLSLIPETLNAPLVLQQKLPDSIDQYQVTAVISRGPTCDVLKGLQDHPRREVAIKVLHNGAGDEQVSRRFLRESQILASLDHIAIARVITAGIFENGSRSFLYFVMEYVPGPTIIDFARSQCMDQTHRVELFVKVCDAVAHAHRNGVIHRDLKPSNILTTEEGLPKLLDFGIASMTGRSLVQSDTGESSRIAGTPSYMSPEQFNAEERADTRSDIYSLGVILYELLTFELPYKRTFSSIIQAADVVRSGKTVPIAVRDKGCPKDLDAIVHQCLEPSPADRYQDVGSLAADLQNYLRGDPVSARLPSLREQSFRLMRRHRIAAAASLALILVLAVSTIVSHLMWRRSVRNEQELAVTIDKLELAQKSITDEVVRRRRSAFNHVLAAANSAWHSSPDLARQWILAPRNEKLAPKSFAWKVQMHRSRRTLTSFHAHDGAVIAVALSPNSDLIATAGNDGKLVLWDAADASIKWTMEVRLNRPNHLAFSPTGDGLLFVDAVGRAVLVAAENGQIRNRFQVHNENVQNATFSIDGDAIVAWNDHSQIAVLDSSGEKLLHSIKLDLSNPISGAFADSASGTLCTVLLNGVVVRRGLSAQGSDSQWALPKPRIHRAAFSPSLRFMAASYQYDHLRVDDLHNPNPPVELPASGEKFDRLAFTTDGRFLISAGRSRVTCRDRDLGWEAAEIRHFDSPISSMSVPTKGDLYAVGLEDGSASICYVQSPLIKQCVADGLVRPKTMLFDWERRSVWTVGASIDRWRLDSRDANRFHWKTEKDITALTGPVKNRVFSCGGSEPVILAADANSSDYVELARTKHRIRSLACSQRTCTVFSGDFKGNVEAWDEQTGEKRFSVTQGSGPITDIQVYDDRDLVVAGTFDGNIAIFNLKGELIRCWRAHDKAVSDIALSTDGRLLYTCSHDRTIAIHDIETGAELERIHYHRERINALALSPDGQTLATGGRDKVIALWDAVTGELQATIDEHTDAITGLAFSPNGASLFSLSRDGTLLRWTPVVEPAPSSRSVN